MKILYIQNKFVKDRSVEVESMKETLIYTHTQPTCCVVCEEEKNKGIFVYKGFLCEDCEKKIVQTDTDDPQYRFYLRQLRKVRFSQNK